MVLMKLLPTIRCVTGVATFALLASAAQANAQSVFVQGNAQGCFGLGCTPKESDLMMVDGVALRYTSNAPVDFSGLTQNGILAINPFVGGLGTLSVGSSPVTTTINSVFNLLVTFSNPTAENPISFDVLLQGKVRNTGQGSVVVDFDPVATGSGQVNDTSPWVGYVAPDGSIGDLRLTAYGTSVPSGGTARLGGLVEVTSTPEPASMLLVGTGLFGVMGIARRRRTGSALVA